MRHNLFILLLFATLIVPSPASGQAEDYKNFRGDLGMVIPAAFGELSAFGIGGYVEPMFNITNKISGGIRLEGNALLGASTGKNTSVGVLTMSSTLLKGEYFFNTTNTRPFVGMGLGLYNYSGGSASENNVSVKSGSNPGIMLQGGYTLGSFRMALNYNLLFGEPGLELSTGKTQSISLNYFGLELGLMIGGGKK